MIQEVMRRKLEKEKARLQQKIDKDAAAMSKRHEPLKHQIGLIDQMLSSLDAFGTPDRDAALSPGANDLLNADRERVQP